MVAAGGVDAKVTAWRASQDHEALVLRGYDLQFAVFHPAGRSIVTGNSSVVESWDAATGQRERVLKVPANRWDFSADGQAFVAADGRGVDAKEVRVGDWETGTVRALGKHRSAVTSVAFSPDATRVASAGMDHTARLWNVADGSEIFILKHKARVYAVAFSPDGRLLASGGDDPVIHLWDTASGQELRTLPRPGNQLRVLAFSPDGTRMLAAALNGIAKVHDPATGQELYALKGHSNWVRRGTFSRDGRRILTGSNDLTARLWDAATGEEVLNLRGAMPIASVAFSPDGRRLATCDITSVRIRDAGAP